eukprot:2455778-Prymnesium_polylepis.2
MAALPPAATGSGSTDAGSGSEVQPSTSLITSSGGRAAECRSRSSAVVSSAEPFTLDPSSIAYLSAIASVAAPRSCRYCTSAGSSSSILLRCSGMPSCSPK